MQYQDYCDKAQKAADLCDAGDYLTSIAVFEELLASDLADLDKAIQCRNIAVCCDKMGYVDQALAWYDEGVRYEEPYMRALLLEYKASYLAEKRRDPESIALYEHLYRLPYLMESDKERIWKNLTILRNPRPA